MSTMKNLVIRPADVSLNPLGDGSNVAGVEVTVAADRDVALSDGTFIAGGVPIVATSMPTAGLRVPILANDDPNITTGAGFSLVVTARYSPRCGVHGRPQEMVRRIVITSADPAVVNFADTKPVRLVPYYMRPSEYVASLEAQVAALERQVKSLQDEVAYLIAHGGTPPVTSPSTPDVTATDLGGGVLDLTGPGVTVNDDGTLTLTGTNVASDGAVVTII